MSLPVDWQFNANHTGLDPSGRIGTGEDTLADYVATVAITEPGGLPENTSFGAGLLGQLKNGAVSAETIGGQLRGLLLNDDRILEVSLGGQTQVGVLSIPVVITPSDGPHKLSGPLTLALIEEIITDLGLEDGQEAS